MRKPTLYKRGNGIRTTPLVTKEIGANHITTGLTHFPAGAKALEHSAAGRLSVIDVVLSDYTPRQGARKKGKLKKIVIYIKRKRP